MSDKLIFNCTHGKEDPERATLPFVAGSSLPCVQLKISLSLIFNCTHGKEDPERATLPFIAANIAAVAGQEAVVLCTIDAVWMGTQGGTDGIAQPGLPVLTELYREYVDNGGHVWLCGS